MMTLAHTTTSEYHTIQGLCELVVTYMCHLQYVYISFKIDCFPQPMQTHMDILLPKFLCQALAQRTERELARGKRTRGDVAPQARRRASK